MRQALFVMLLLLAPACAKQPPNLDPATLKVWQANEAVVAIGTVQHAAIELNRAQICEPAPCRPILSDTNTRTVINVVESALISIRQVPTGWKATGIEALAEIEKRLDEAGKTKLVSYVQAARTIIEVLN